MPEKICKICGSHDIGEIDVGGHQLLNCNKCTAVFSAEIPGEEELRDYYESEYRIATAGELAIEQRRISRLPEQLQLIREISEYKQPPAQIVDIGCDRGFFLDEARRMGYETAGVEPSAAGRRYAENIGLDVRPAFDEIPGEFDICTMWHSLEHHRDPVGSLREIRGRLRDGGMIFVRVPNFDQLWQKVFGERWIWFQPENHYYHFSKKSLATALTRAGFSPQKIESRRPNTPLTRQMSRAAWQTFRSIFGINTTFRKKVGKIYENLTGVEVFAAARKNP
jgi:2-polyprenyl-3-methyl-5-hydroxy-6-metoxy-1,4-benzoquinol methylase